MRRLDFGDWRAPSMSRVNFWFNQLFYGLSAIAGSITSFFLSGALIWALVRLVQGRISPAVDRRIKLLAFVFALYPLAELWSVLVNNRGSNGLVAILGQVVFLAVLPVSSRLILSRPNEILASAGSGAAAAGLIAFAYSAFEFLVLGITRTEAGYGNPAVMGVVALVLACICLVAKPGAEGRARSFINMGAIAAIGAVLLSGTRGVWLAAPVSLVLASLPAWRSASFKLNKRNAVATGAVALMLAGIAAPVALNRYNETMHSVEVLEAGGTDISIGPRLTLWQAGLRQAADRPWTGFGPDSVREKILSIKPDGSLGYSHYHNFVINSLIRGGILELLTLLAIPAALVMLSLQNSRNDHERAGRALLLSLCATFYLTGIVGILFTHDIMNATFVYTAIIGICLATGAYAPERDVIDKSQASAVRA
jgi:O-antigen ligase